MPQTTQLHEAPPGNHPLLAEREGREILAPMPHADGFRDPRTRRARDLAAGNGPQEREPRRLPTMLPNAAGGVAPRHVRRAEAYMRRNIVKAITVAELADEVCVSVRALQSGFRRFRGATPLETLRGLRLEAARADLQRADASDTVTGIALQWGFTHLSRFSQNYKARFGELPLQTLRRR